MPSRIIVKKFITNKQKFARQPFEPLYDTLSFVAKAGDGISVVSKVSKVHTSFSLREIDEVVKFETLKFTETRLLSPTNHIVIYDF